MPSQNSEEVVPVLVDLKQSSHLERFTRELELNWQLIHDEFFEIPGSLYMPWPWKFQYTGNWSVFGLFDRFGVTQNHVLERNRATCPMTVAILHRFPMVACAGFSILYPGTIIKPHRDDLYARPLVRCHLPLTVPENCGIAFWAGDPPEWVEIRWAPGKCLAFNEHYEHKAWNLSKSPRVVLITDVADDV